MEDILNIKVKNDQQLVSARELHKGLGLKKQFTDWVKQNFKEFKEGTDFMFTPQSVNMPNGGIKPIKDYALTIDMAKQLCLMSRTEKGKIYRSYLIEVEKRWNNPAMVVQRALIIQQNQIKQLKSQNKELKGKNKSLSIQLEESNKKANYLDIILATKDAMTATQIAFDYGMSPIEFNKLLFIEGIQHKVHGQWVLYKVYMGKGYTKTNSGIYKDKNDRYHSKPYTMWTQKGRKLIYDILKQDDIYPLIERKDVE